MVRLTLVRIISIWLFLDRQIRIVITLKLATNTNIWATIQLPSWVVSFVLGYDSRPLSNSLTGHLASKNICASIYVSFHLFFFFLLLPSTLYHFTRNRNMSIEQVLSLHYYYYYYYYYLLIKVFHISVSWWYFTGVWVTASLLKSPGLFSVFWSFSLM